MDEATGPAATEDEGAGVAGRDPREPGEVAIVVLANLKRQGEGECGDVRMQGPGRRAPAGCATARSMRIHGEQIEAR